MNQRLSDWHDFNKISDAEEKALEELEAAFS